MDKKKCAWDFFENFYKNSIQEGKTFSLDIYEQIQNEMDKMAKEYNDWIDQKEKDKK